MTRLPDIRCVELPAGSTIVDRSGQPAPDLADAWSVALPAGTTRDPETLARHLFARRPWWVAVLLGLRDLMVAGLGLKTTRALARHSRGETPPRVGLFRLYSSNADEVVLGEDDRHLDFRLSVRCAPDSRPMPARHDANDDLDRDTAPQRLIVTTVVHCHNRLGRAYIVLIGPFHRLVVRGFLRSAARAGWPATPSR